MDPFRVLIIDKDASMSIRLGAFLARQGYDAQVRETVEAAHRSLGEDRWDAVLIDVDLPGDGAASLCLAARRRSAWVHVVLMASPAADADSLMMMDFDSRLDKPFKGREVRGLLRQVLGKNIAVLDTDPSVEMVASASVRPDGEVKKPGKPTRTEIHTAGTLVATPFPALLYKLFANQSTGILSLHRQNSERTIFFRDGEPVFAASNAASDNLGSVLVKFGYVEMEALNDTLESRPDGVQFGQLLVQRGLIEPEALLEAMDRQIHERILGCFSFYQGTYLFEDTEDWIDDVRHFRQNPIELIVDGVHSYVGANVLASRFQPHMGSYLVRTEKFEVFEPHLPMTPWRQEVLGRIDGSRTLQALVGEAGKRIMDLLKFAWALKEADMIDFSALPRTWAERSPDKPPLPNRPPTLRNLPRAVRDEALKQARESQAEIAVMSRPGADDAERDTLTAVVVEYTIRRGAQDHWQLLELTKGATVAEASEALQFALARIPLDKLGLLPAERRRQAMEVRAALERAFKVISEPRSRQRYTQEIELRRAAIDDLRQREADSVVANRRDVDQASAAEALDGWAPTPDRPTGQAWKAQGLSAAEDPDIEAQRSRVAIELRKARAAIAEGRFKDAWRGLKVLTNLDSQNHEANVLMAWAIYNIPHDDRARQLKVCRSRIEFELALDDSIPEAWLFLGHMAEEQGELAEALRHYRAALVLDRKFEEARQGIARLKVHPELFEAEKKNGGGVLDRLIDLFKR